MSILALVPLAQRQAIQQQRRDNQRAARRFFPRQLFAQKQHAKQQRPHGFQHHNHRRVANRADFLRVCLQQKARVGNHHDTDNQPHPAGGGKREMPCFKRQRIAAAHDARAGELHGGERQRVHAFGKLVVQHEKQRAHQRGKGEQAAAQRHLQRRFTRVEQIHTAA